MRKLKIAVDGRPAVWDRTGIGTITYNFLKLIQSVDSKNEYFYYFDSDPLTLQSQLQLKNCRYKNIKNKLLWANLFVPIQLIKDRIDIFITFLEKDIPFFTFGKKQIITICDLIPLKYPETSFRNRFHKLYYLTLMHLAVRKSDIILTISDNSKKDIVDWFGIADHKVNKITLGVDKRYCADRNVQDVLAKYNISGSYILAVGATEPRKNNTTVIKAFNMIAKQFPFISLVIIGKKWRDCEFDQKLLNNKIILAGFVDDDDMPYIYKNASLLVFPSLYEGFGLPILEAMSYGVPVITSNTSSLPEVGGDAVLYVDPNNVNNIQEEITRVLSEPLLSKSLVAKGDECIEKFRWEIMCNEITSIFYHVASKERTR